MNPEALPADPIAALRQAPHSVEATGNSTRLALESTASTSGSTFRGADSELTATVRRFYEELPFNFHGEVESAAAAIRAFSLEHRYPDLARSLDRRRPRTSVLDVGCGAGWFSHALALHRGLDVEGIDLSANALARARQVGIRLGTGRRVRFEQRDVFELGPGPCFDLIVSLGALHHTSDARRAFACAARRLAPGGRMFVGLYHAHGRRVFLDEMARLVRTAGEEAAFRRYRGLDRAHRDDETLARSWFRDQVLHPHESQHTLREIVGWLDELGLELASTSVNRFGPVGDRAALFGAEERLADVARRALFEEGRYYPGFFTVLAARSTGSRAVNAPA